MLKIRSGPLACGGKWRGKVTKMIYRIATGEIVKAEKVRGFLVVDQ